MSLKELFFRKKQVEVVTPINENRSDEILISYVINLYKEKKLKLNKIDDSEIIFKIIKI